MLLLKHKASKEGGVLRLEGFYFFYRVVRESLNKGDIWVKAWRRWGGELCGLSEMERGNSKCKGPEVDVSLKCSRSTLERRSNGEGMCICQEWDTVLQSLIHKLTLLFHLGTVPWCVGVVCGCQLVTVYESWLLNFRELCKPVIKDSFLLKLKL